MTPLVALCKGGFKETVSQASDFVLMPHQAPLQQLVDQRGSRWYPRQRPRQQQHSSAGRALARRAGQKIQEAMAEVGAEAEVEAAVVAEEELAAVAEFEMEAGMEGERTPKPQLWQPMWRLGLMKMEAGMEAETPLETQS